MDFSAERTALFPTDIVSGGSGDGECWKRFDGCLPIITSDLFRHAPLSSLKIQRVASPKSVSFQVISSAHFLSHYRVELVVCYRVGLTLI